MRRVRAFTGIDENNQLQIAPHLIPVAKGLLDGKSNKEIADELQISIRTVKSYCNQLFKAFNIDTGYKRVRIIVILFNYKDRLENMVQIQTSKLLKERVPWIQEP